MITSRDLTAIILAGGESRRMGEDKGLKPFKGTPLVLNPIKLFEGLGFENIFVN